MSDDDLTAAAAAMGKKGGQVGGKSRSPAKIEAGRRNAAKARAARMARTIQDVVPRESADL